MGSSPIIYPIFYLNYIYIKYILIINFWNNIFLKKVNFLITFYKFNYNILNEGLLIDFLQKYSLVFLLKKSIFNTFFLFNEKFNFESISHYLIDLLFWSKNFFIIQNIKSININFQLIFLFLLIAFLFLIF